MIHQVLQIYHPLLELMFLDIFFIRVCFFFQCLVDTKIRYRNIFTPSFLIYFIQNIE